MLQFILLQHLFSFIAHVTTALVKPVISLVTNHMRTWFTLLRTVAHPSTNRAQRTATLLMAVNK